MSPISTTNDDANPRADQPRTPAITFRRLAADCGRGVFSCGDDEIDGWFRAKSLDQHLDYRCRVVTAHLKNDDEPVGFFAMGIKLEKDTELDPTSRAQSRSQSGYFSSVQLSSVAVKKGMQRRGIGTVLMGAALAEFYQVVIRSGVYALTLVAANKDVVGFYERLGFVTYGGAGDGTLKMILPAASVVEMIESAGPVNPVL